MQFRRYPIFPLAYFGFMAFLGIYFSVAAVAGDYGVFRRADIEAEAAKLKKELKVITEEVDVMENLTRRLSDEFLDLDLLDERARDVLGVMRADEIVIR
jgi:cell division protein FtsB